MGKELSTEKYKQSINTQHGQLPLQKNCKTETILRCSLYLSGWQKSKHFTNSSNGKARGKQALRLASGTAKWNNHFVEGNLAKSIKITNVFTLWPSNVPGAHYPADSPTQVVKDAQVRLLLAVMLWNSMMETPHVPVYRGWDLKQNKRNTFTILHSWKREWHWCSMNWHGKFSRCVLFYLTQREK